MWEQSNAQCAIDLSTGGPEWCGAGGHLQEHLLAVLSKECGHKPVRTLRVQYLRPGTQRIGHLYRECCQ